MSAIPFDPGRFRSAAPHYLRGRPDYAEGLIADVAALCRLDGTGRLLDLGCGPGQLAKAFRPFVAEAVGMDPEPEMLALAAASAGGAGITWRRGSSYDLSPATGPFRLVTVGRAFHWMDRVATVRCVAEMLHPAGALVLFHTDHLAVPDNAWRVTFDSVVAAARGGAVAAWQQPGWPRNEAVLLDSPLANLHRIGVIERRQVLGDHLVDRALSLSSTSLQRLSEAGAAKLRDEVTALVAAVAVDGLVTEVVESVALIARR